MSALDEIGSTGRVVKLARSQMTAWKRRHLKEVQGGICPLCGKPIDLTIKGEGVIDHDHDTGRIRGVLHRSCNAAEGKVSNAAARWGAKSSEYSAIIQYLEAIITYLKSPPTCWIYPMHKSVEERGEERRAKAREARAALKAKRELAKRRRDSAN